MESVRKAAEMVIEEVHIKGNSKCFLFVVCVKRWSILHKTCLVFMC